MRICYVCHSNDHFIPPYVDFFAGRGHEIHVVSLVRQALPNVINHHPLNREFDPRQASAAYFWMLPRMRRVIRSIRPDIVHAHYLPSNGMMAAFAGVHPLVVTAHGSDVHHSLRHPIKRRAILYAMKRADLVNPVSRDLEEKILELGIPEGKIVRATLGVETQRFASVPADRHGGPPRILCTRKLFPVYNCELIVRAAAILAKRGVEFELVFAAGGPEEARLRELAAAAHLGRTVAFQGGYPFSELPRMLAGADIYVSASLSDGTSLSLLEAMAAGVFPVVSDIPANREWLTGQGDCMLFGTQDHATLANQLQGALADAELRRSAVERNRQRVWAEGDRERNMCLLASHYERLITGMHLGGDSPVRCPKS